jgi:hypothetical protein
VVGVIAAAKHPPTMRELTKLFKLLKCETCPPSLPPFMFVTPRGRKGPKGNKWRIGTAVLRIRMAGGVGGGS